MKYLLAKVYIETIDFYIEKILNSDDENLNLIYEGFVNDNLKKLYELYNKEKEE